MNQLMKEKDRKYQEMKSVKEREKQKVLGNESVIESTRI